MAPFTKLAAVLCVAALVAPVCCQVSSQEFVGSDYGDVISGLRRQLDSDAYSYGGDNGSPSSITRIRLRLRDIESRLRTESGNAARVYDIQYKYLTNRLINITTAINETSAKVENIKEKTKETSERIVDRQIFLKRVPVLQERKRVQIKAQNDTINTLLAQRARVNIRFHHRLQHAKDTISASEHVKSFLDPSTFSGRLATLKDALNVHHDPTMTALLDSVGPNMQERQHDLGDVNDLLGSLNGYLHNFITDLTTTEVEDSNQTALTLAGMNDVLALLQSDLNQLLGDEIVAKKESEELMQSNIKMHKQYPALVFRLQRLNASKAKLDKARDPLMASYALHKEKRDKQLADVTSLQTLIKAHYDPEARSPGPADGQQRQQQ